VNTAEFRAHTLYERRIVVCVGCGGVGKTTVAAALALEAARGGRRALVLTIDPARRLADALGVQALGNEPQPIPEATLSRLGVPADGSLWAMMLDMKRTFDDLVDRFAENDEARERILVNPIYQHVSDALAGSVEYSAMEKVYELVDSGSFDLIVVDTPPAQHALDFLEAPQRLLEFLDSRLVHMLIHPAFAAGRFGFRLFQRSARRVLQVIERLTGIGFIEDLSEFLLAFEGMAEGFRTRAGHVRALLLGPEASFVLVAGPERESTEQAMQFLDRLEAFGVPLAGVVANRVRVWPGGGEAPERDFAAGDVDRLREALAAQEGPEFPADVAARAAVDAAAGYAALVRRDERALRGLRERTLAVGRFWSRIPELPRDVHDLDGLDRIGRFLFEPPKEEALGTPGQAETGTRRPA
jgi:anion-transporting  ArsA/GET3 family ATPase